MIYFNLPGLYEHFDLNILFIEWMTNHPEWFNDNVKIKSVFGNFPYCSWDGGRNFCHYQQVTQEEMIKVKNSYNVYNVNTRFIFTNPVLTKQDLDDRFNNLMLRVCGQEFCEVVINSDLMKNYIHTNYPQYKLVSSTTKCITDPQKVLDEIHNSEYYQICLDYNMNKNKEFLESIPKEDRHKVEFLVNAICPPNCPHRKQHYAETGQAHLTYLKDNYSVAPWCGIGASINDPTKLGQGNNLSFDDIVEYNKMGFQHFKLEGRTLSSSVMFANYLYYLVKPEYYFILIEMIMETDILINNYNKHTVYKPMEEKKYALVVYDGVPAYNL